MDQLGAALLVTGLYPLYRAWRAVRRTTLRHALLWAIAAWLAWIVAWAVGGPEGQYLALCLTACAGVAVLGARRPGYVAWNFVVVGLLLVLALPFLHGLGELRLDLASLVLPGLVLAVGIGNYLPSHGCLAAALLGVWCGVEMAVLFGAVSGVAGVMPMMLAIVPWLWLRQLRRWEPHGWESDRQWEVFNNTFGILWAVRMRVQFDRAVKNAGVNWETVDPQRVLELQRAVLQRFEVPPD